MKQSIGPDLLLYYVVDVYYVAIMFLEQTLKNNEIKIFHILSILWNDIKFHIIH
jgi:hypothetical protein